MRVIQLTAENFKRLEAVDITPDGDVVVIAGENGHGKTSVLDAIWVTLCGVSKKEMPEPVRQGAKGAVVRLDLGDLIVTRTWTAEGKSSLKVESAKGARSASPQAVLDSLVGKLSFDPLTFANQDARGQLATLLEVIELPFDPDELAAERKRLYEERTVVGRRRDEYKGQLAGMDDPQDAPAELVDIAAATEALGEAMAAKTRADAIVASCQQINQEVLDLEQRIAQLRARKEGLMEEWTSIDVPDVDDLRLAIAEAEAGNERWRAAQARREVTQQWQAADADYREYTDAIEAIDQRRHDGVAAAAMPIEGLSFDEDGVLYQGVPFKQASSAEQLRVSVAMAMAMNPEVRVIRITDGSLLDRHNMALIEEMAHDQDYQVWVERVDSSGEVGIVIENGRIA